MCSCFVNTIYRGQNVPFIFSSIAFFLFLRHTRLSFSTYISCVRSYATSIRLFEDRIVPGGSGFSVVVPPTHPIASHEHTYTQMYFPTHVDQCACRGMHWQCLRELSAQFYRMALFCQSTYVASNSPCARVTITDVALPPVRRVATLIVKRFRVQV